MNMTAIIALLLLLTGVCTVHCQVFPCDTETELLFHCSDGKTCVRRTPNFCNGIAECPDGSDEYAFNASMEGELGMGCNYRWNNVSSICHLPDRHKCDHELDCTGGYDECNCTHTFDCDNGECALKVTFCNGIDECSDGSDEKRFDRAAEIGFQCPVTSMHETRICVLPDRYVCDGDSDCDEGIDECFCDFSSGEKKGVYLNNSFSNEKCFRCLDRSSVIPNKHVCDGIVHCQDMSDECICTHKKNFTMPDICKTVCDGVDCDCKGNLKCKPMNGTETSDKICVPETAICDSILDCADGVDEQYCPASDQFFHCYDNITLIRKTLFCNGKNDCKDGSDELHCGDLTDYYCHYYRVYFPAVTDWENTTQTSAVVGIPPGFELPKNYPLYTNRCDGVPMCSELDDECYASGCAGPRPGFCDFVSALGEPFRCPVSGSLIIGVEICDGKPSCNDTNPEVSEDELFCPNRFNCENNGSSRLPIHLPLSSKCNGIQECDDQSDELGCPTSTHFYCNDRGSKKFIRRTEVCDGTLDCSLGSDECQNCNPNPFSSDQKLISSRVLIVFLWIIGLVSVIGNLGVVIHQLRNLICPEVTPSEVGKLNRLLVLNLSLADLLVGIYLLALGIKDALIDEYCLLDQEWRSGSTCSALGTIALIGTETSVFVLTIMAAYRLYIVVRPYKSQNVSFVKYAIVVAWILSLILALLPYAASLKDYFVSCVWYRNNDFFGRICHSEMETFTRQLAMMDSPSGRFTGALKSGYSWDNMFNVVKEINSAYVPERYFGYYSAHSVCLPRLFPDPNEDKSWGYSLFLVLLNFIALVFILVSYIQIYRQTTKQTIGVRANVEDRTAAIQRKVTRIVATDFCCWMPICIMAFVKVSGVYVSDDSYAVTAVILLPINSAMNPFLYSDVVDFIWLKMMPLRDWCGATSCGQKIEQISAERRERGDVSTTSGVTRVSRVAHSGQSASSQSIKEIKSVDEMPNPEAEAETQI